MAREKSFDPRRLDVPAFATAGALLEGQAGQQVLARLQDSVQAPGPGEDPAPPVRWSVKGLARPVTGGQPELWLHLQAETAVHLQCQRCLQTLSETLVVDRQFRFVTDAEEAERLDEELEDDVMVVSRALDLLGLLEDELILELPLVPRHEVCPEALPMSVADEGADETEAAPNPFAALAALRKPGGEGGEGGGSAAGR